MTAKDSFSHIWYHNISLPPSFPTMLSTPLKSNASLQHHLLSANALNLDMSKFLFCCRGERYPGDLYNMLSVFTLSEIIKSDKHSENFV